MKTTSQAKRPFIALTTTILALTALAVPAAASAQSGRVDGVGASVRHGTLQVRGGDQSSQLVLRGSAAQPGQIQVDVGADGSADFSFAKTEIDAVDVKMGDGNDSVRVDDAAAPFTTTIPTTIAGGDGNDRLDGGEGAETLRGGDGEDAIDGGRGADTAYMGGGNDVFQWDPGEGSDVIEGQDGDDTMLFNGANVAEQVTMSANGDRLRFFRVQANITMDTDGVEFVQFNALGGVDSIVVNDLSATDVVQTRLDLGAGDAAADSVTVDGTEGDDNIDVTGIGNGRVDVTGLANTVSVRNAEPADTLAIRTLAGIDTVHATDVAGILRLLVDGVLQ